jgi:hypothetical protein
VGVVGRPLAPSAASSPAGVRVSSYALDSRAGWRLTAQHSIATGPASATSSTPPHPATVRLSSLAGCGACGGGDVIKVGERMHG